MLSDLPLYQKQEALISISNINLSYIRLLLLCLISHDVYILLYCRIAVVLHICFVTCMRIPNIFVRWRGSIYGHYNKRIHINSRNNQLRFFIHIPPVTKRKTETMFGGVHYMWLVYT